MIREFEFFHGVVFARILHGVQRSVEVSTFPTNSNSSYVLDQAIGIYIKYSSKRMTPWRFTFRQDHQDEINEMRKQLGSVFLILVCNDDGIVCLSYSELKQILDEQHDSLEWVSATRRPREMYAIKGSNGRLEFKIGANEFPAKLFAKTL